MDVEDAARYAAHACADSVTVLQAVAADGAVGFTEVTAVAFIGGAGAAVVDLR